MGKLSSCATAIFLSISLSACGGSATSVHGNATGGSASTTVVVKNCVGVYADANCTPEERAKQEAEAAKTGATE